MSNESLNNISKELNSLKPQIKNNIYEDTPFETLFKDLFKELIRFFLEGEFSKVSEEEIKNSIGKNLKALTSEDFKPPIDSRNNSEDEKAIYYQREKELERCINTIQVAFESALYFNSLSLGKQNITDVIEKIDKEIFPKIRINSLREGLIEVLRLTYHDFEFVEDVLNLEGLIEKLCKIINLFQRKETGMEEFQKPVLEKAAFLLYKVLLSYDENERLDFFVMFEGKKKTCKELIRDVGLSIRSKNLISLINLYEKEKLSVKEIKELQKLKQEFSDDKLLPAYIDVKIYKDSASLDLSKPAAILDSLNKIQEIHDSLEDVLGDDVLEFDSVSVNTNKIFILNNLISLAGEFLVHFNNMNMSSDKIDSIYKLVNKAINQIQKIESNPRNYFTHYKYSKFLHSYYIYQVKNNHITENLQNLLEEIEKYAKTASNLLYKLERFQRYRLDHDGSCIYIGDEDKKVFIYSSINLLFDYFGQRSLIEVQNVKANTIEVYKKMQELEQKTKEDVKKDLEQTKEDTKDQVNRVTQNVVGLLGIFSAVITFAFGSIQLFQHLTNFSQAFILMSLFGFSTIVTFLCVMYVVYQERDFCENVIKPVMIALVVYLAIMLIGNYFFKDWPLSSQTISNKIMKNTNLVH